MWNLQIMHLITLRLSNSLTIVGLVQLAITALSASRLGYILAPGGLFCPGEGNSNFTLCPAGTYQSKKAQSDCSRCPIGYACPDKGMHVPRLCPYRICL